MKSRIIITAIDNPTIQIVPQLSQGNIFVVIFGKEFGFQGFIGLKQNSRLYRVGKKRFHGFMGLEKDFMALWGWKKDFKALSGGEKISRSYWGR